MRREAILLPACSRVALLAAMRVILWLVILALAGCLLKANASEPALPAVVELGQAPETVALRPSLSMVRDDSGTMHPEQAFESAQQGRTVPLVVTGAPYRSALPHWGIARVRAVADELNWILYYRLGTIEEVDVYARRPDGTWLPLPAMHANANLLGGYHYPSFSLDLHRGELVDIAVRVKTRAPIRMSLFAVPGYHYYASQRTELVVAGMTLAVPLVVLLYLILLLPVSRRTGIGWFIALIALETIGAMWVSGHGHVLFPMIGRDIWPTIGRVVYTAMIIAGWKHAVSFLGTHLFPAWLKRGGWSLVGLMVLLGAVETLQIANTRSLFTLGVLVFPMAITAMSVYAWRGKVAFAGLYALSWGAFVVAGLIASLGLFGVIGMIGWSLFYAQSSVAALLFGLVAIGLVRERERELEHARGESALLLAREQQLADALQMRLRFFAATNHDLRQPLQSLGIYAEMADREVRESRLSGPIGGYVSKIRLAYSSVGHFIDGLTDLSRLDANMLTPNIQTVQLGDMLFRLAQEYQPLAGQFGLELRYISTRAQVSSDPVLLERMVRNVLGNALRYTREGGLLIGVRRRAYDWRIDVIDTGPGIDLESQKRVFGEFHFEKREDARGALSSSGQGLGLAIVERLSAALGHRFELVSQMGRGTRASVYAAAVGAAPEAAKHENVDAAPLQGVSVLLIDDDRDVLSGLTLLLRQAGASVSAIASVEHLPGIDASALATFRVVVADFRLANGTLLDHAPKLRDLLPQGCAWIVLSGSTEREVAAQVKTLAAVAHFTKPVETAKLINAVRLAARA